MQADSPASPAARFYNSIVGHLVGLAAGFLAVFMLTVYDDPVTLAAHQLTLGRAAAASLAILLTVLVGLLLKASHPPAGATALLVALGSFKIADVPAILIGVLLVSALGEVARRMRLGQLTLRPMQKEKNSPAPRLNRQIKAPGRGIFCLGLYTWNKSGAGYRFIGHTYPIRSGADYFSNADMLRARKAF